MGLRQALLTWFDQHARDLPFRHTRDPYAIWVSEVMLQQTRVETVIPYYKRFMARFPTANDLAAADEDEVMSLWSGLGYYRRARLLHRGVKEVSTHYGGQVPASAEARRQLPGIGRYTAGAIGSIAFDQPEPIVDGNVARVFSRLYGIDTPLGQSVTERKLWEAAEALVQGPRPGTLNQALMELGATVCVKSRPLCDRCPIASDCYARAEGQTANLPVPRQRRAPRKVELIALAALSNDGQHVWLTRGDGTLFGGLWNLPMLEGSDSTAAQTLLEQTGLRGQLPAEPSAHFTHILTHRRLEVALFAVPVQGQPRASASLRVQRAKTTELDSLGVSSLTRKALELVESS